MPQPFEQFNMQQLEKFTKKMFRDEAKKINVPKEHGDLAFFLVHNFKSELTSSEHVVDTAIRLLKKMSNRQNPDECDATDDAMKNSSPGK